MSLIQSRAPEHSSKYAVSADSHCRKIDLRYKKEDSSKYTVLLVLRAAFHPQTTQEVISYSSWIESYKEINCDIVGIVKDSYESIHEWVMAPESEGGLANSQEFPIISDKAFPGLVSQLGVKTLESYGDNAIIIVDPVGKIRYWAAFPPDVGRGETLNIVASIREVDRNNGTVLTPADWMEGDPVIPNDRLGIDKFYRDNYGMNRGGFLEMIKSTFSNWFYNDESETETSESKKNEIGKVKSTEKDNDTPAEKIELVEDRMINDSESGTVKTDGKQDMLKTDEKGDNDTGSKDSTANNTKKENTMNS